MTIEELSRELEHTCQELVLAQEQLGILQEQASRLQQERETSMCCVFRDGILHILVVTSGYLSYCYLSIISNQSAHSSLTSTRHFRPQNCLSLDIFSFSDHSL